MKSIKRIIALLLTAVMTMTMSVTAFAADSSCSLTVNVKEEGQDLKDQTINLYKLFDVTTSQSGKTTNYAYTVNDIYRATLATTLGIEETSKNEDFVQKVNDLKDTTGAVQKFANDFTATALTNKRPATTNSGKITESKTSFKFDDLAAGYYLVYVTGGREIQSSLVTVTGKNDEVYLKTTAPSIKKTADKGTVSIGEVVKYTVKGSVPDTTGYEQYVYKIHDELSNGLDFVNDENGAATSNNEVNVTVAFNETGVTAVGTAPTKAKLDTSNKRKMSLDLSEWVRANQTNKGKDFTVTYYAKVNKDAVVTEKNSAKLEYGNDPDNTTTTTPSEAKTPTYHLDINKHIKGQTTSRLAGAKFSLYNSETDAKNGTNAIKVAGRNGNYVVDPTSENTVFESVESITGESYNLRVNGLAEGTYYLVETKAPEGYNKLTDPIKVDINKSANENVNDWTLSKNGAKEDDKIIDVENSTGSLLPSTGGMGTIAFAVVAAILVFCVAVSFIRDRKREN